MDPDKKIKPAEIKDEELNEAQGGLRAFKHAGIRATNVTMEGRAETITAKHTPDKISLSYDLDHAFGRKRPGKVK